MARIQTDARGSGATDSQLVSADANALAVGPNGSTNPTLQVDTSTASAATGIKVKSAAAAGGVAVSAVSSGTAESLTIDAKGTGTITLAGTSTGAITLGTATTAASSVKSTSPSAGIGYATGAGGAVTQITSRSTAVTMVPNPCISGTITTVNSSLAAEASADFIVTDSAVAIGDVVVVCIQSGSNGGGTSVSVPIVTAGTFTIRTTNNNVAAGTAETGVLLINFAIIKAVSA